MEAIPHDLIARKRAEREDSRRQARKDLQAAKDQLQGNPYLLAAIEALEVRIEQLENG
jgi:hypothetical protein